jgi:hypothetical protein
MSTLEAIRLLGFGGTRALLDQQALRFVITAERRLALAARDEALAFQVSAPAAYAGTYAIQPAVVAGAPVALTQPAIEGIPQVGQTLTVRTVLWVHDGFSSDPSRTWQWRRGGVPIAGATETTYSLQPADAGSTIDVVETLIDASGPQSFTAPQVTVAA